MSNQPNNTEKYLFGGLSGILSRGFVAPFDRIKILSQTGQITENKNRNIIFY